MQPIDHPVKRDAGGAAGSWINDLFDGYLIVGMNIYWFRQGDHSLLTRVPSGLWERIFLWRQESSDESWGKHHGNQSLTR